MENIFETYSKIQQKTITYLDTLYQNKDTHEAYNLCESTDKESRHLCALALIDCVKYTTFLEATINEVLQFLNTDVLLHNKDYHYILITIQKLENEKLKQRIIELEK